MKKFIDKNSALISFVLFSLFITITCIYLEIKQARDLTKAVKENFNPPDHLSEIIKRKKIRMLTDNNANSYYMYRGETMGFEYDLAKEFAAFLQVELEVVAPGWNNMFSYLEKGRGDFIAAGLSITEQREKNLLFSQPYMEVQQKFIYHKNLFPIKKIEDLKGKTIHVRKATSYYERLKEIKKAGIPMYIELYDDMPTEEFLRMVAKKEIKYTIADSNIALLNRRYYPDIRIGISLQEKEYFGWAVNPENINLANKIDQFFQLIENNGFLGKIYEKYYGNIEVFDYFDLKKFHERLKTRLPKYKRKIIKESEKYGFDWRMIAAVIYQESHFDPNATSITGVRGIMQVTLDTANEMGITDRLDPKQSIEAGVKYLNKMYKKFDYISDPLDRLKFALGSYNIGYGHVRDAQKLAQKQGLDQNKWSSMMKILPLLTKPKYYMKTKHGYARGREPVQYIKRIFTYYDILKQKAQALTTMLKINYCVKPYSDNYAN